MNLDETIHTTARIDAIQDPARLERVRQRRDTRPSGPHRPHAVVELAMRLGRVSAWRHGVPASVPPVVAETVPTDVVEVVEVLVVAVPATVPAIVPAEVAEIMPAAAETHPAVAGVPAGPSA